MFLLIRKNLYYVIWFIFILEMIRGDDFVLFIGGCWFFLIALLIRNKKKQLLKVFLADFIINGDHSIKKAVNSGLFMFFLGILSYIFK